MKLLVLRPQPGADATAGAAAKAGLEAVVAPLFTVQPLNWEPPDPAAFHAVVMTSANAARHGGPGLARYRRLPVHAVGKATAAAAREAGFANVASGAGDAAALFEAIAAGPHRRLLHLCGAHHIQAVAPGLQLLALPVYASVAATQLPGEIERICGEGAVALIHSPRAGALFAALLAARVPRAGVTIVAISDAAARACGLGWRGVSASLEPTDRAMLAIASPLCETGA